MAIRLLEITEQKNIIITEHALDIPEIKFIVDNYENYITVIKYCYYMTVPDSPFNNMEEEEKKEAILESLGVEFSLDDVNIQNCINRLEKLYETPTMRLYKALRKSMDAVATYLQEAVIDGAKDGNLDNVRQYQQNIGKIHESFKKLEKAAEDEFKIALRGKQKIGRY